VQASTRRFRFVRIDSIDIVVVIDYKSEEINPQFPSFLVFEAFALVESRANARRETTTKPDATRHTFE
jgi:hypothetical protein